MFTPTKENNIFLPTGLKGSVKGEGLVAGEAELLNSLLNSCSVVSGHGYLKKLRYLLSEVAIGAN